MKLVASVAALGLASASKLQPMQAVSDECVGCENAPPAVFTCLNPPCDSEVCGEMAVNANDCEGDNCAVDCSLETGYYRDNKNCRAYCFCSGDVDDGTGNSVPSRYHVCPPGTFWDGDCDGFHNELANGMGYEGGCCNHAASLLNFHKCPGGCERLSKYHCGKSSTCSWNADCECCQEGEPEPEPELPAATEKPAKAKCAGKPLDVSFIVDGSGSIGPVNFELVKKFLLAIVDNLDVGPTQVSCVQYSKQHVLEFGGLSNRADVVDKITNMPYQGKRTFTGQAINFWNQEQANYRRNGVPAATMVFTDGITYDPKADDVSIRGPELQANTKVIAVGVAKAQMAQLEHIASNPDSENVFFNADWDYLLSIADQIAEGLCDSEEGINNLHG